MAMGGRRAAGLALVLAVAGPWRASLGASDARSGASPQADDRRIVHVLNRLGYGPRPGELERVRRLGLEKWIDQQLHPDHVRDEALDARLRSLETLQLSSAALMGGYDIPRQARREIQEKKAELGDGASPEDARRIRRELMEKYRPEMEGTPREVIDQLQSAKILRAVYSERQLDELIVDFWMNHFNVYASKGPDRFLIGEYERAVVRPRAWGRFEDLLKATAESPAMLFYLDNWLSADPNADRSRPRANRGLGTRPDRFGLPRPRRPEGPMRDPEDRRSAEAKGRRRGLNENYAREVMELHTLGVDGGYTQKDVTEVARCFTGWTIRGLREQKPEFDFDPRIHDSGQKVVLGHRIKGGGKGEGDEVIHVLATHPSTARFIAYKLARRFVADEPPPALVDRAADTFRKTGGDIRAVVTTLVTSPQFLAPETREAKVKTPLEFVVSAVRASGAEVDDARVLARRIGQMGMPLYLQQPPTGYKDTAEAWVSTSGLLARLNFALDLAGGRVRGVRVDLDALASRPPEGGSLTASLCAVFVPSGISETTRRTLDAEAGLDPARVAGLILGSPEFQRR